MALQETKLTFDEIEDYIYNSFTNTESARYIGTGGARGKERRQVPATAPYIISLFDAPREDIPSTMKIELLDASGTVIKELKEVSKTTTPADSEYRVNYDAKGIGQIELNSGQKAEFIDISYYGLGSIHQKAVFQIKLSGINTISVASSDSSTDSQNIADSIILTGEDAGARLNTIISDLNSNGGGTINLFEGTYNIETTISLLSDVNLKGQGYSTKINKNGNLDIMDITGSNCIVSEIQFDGNEASVTGQGIELNTGSNCIIEKCYIHDFKTHGIYVNSIRHKIKSNFIYNNVQYGIYVSENNIIVDNNTIYNNTDSGIYIDDEFNTITDNSLSNNLNGIELIGTANNVISDNLIQNSSNYGIFLSSIAISNNISGNQIKDNQKGIYFGSSNDYNNITGNYVYSNNEEGIEINSSDYLCITGNHIYDNTQDGIEINTSTSNTITGNHIYSNGSEGIDCNNLDDTVITGNNLIGNTGQEITLDASSDSNIIQTNKTVVGSGLSNITDNGTNNSVQTNY